MLFITVVLKSLCNQLHIAVKLFACLTPCFHIVIETNFAETADRPGISYRNRFKTNILHNVIVIFLCIMTVLNVFACFVSYIHICHYIVTFILRSVIFLLFFCEKQVFFSPYLQCFNRSITQVFVCL